MKYNKNNEIKQSTLLWPKSTKLTRKKEVIINYLHIGHTHITYYYIILLLFNYVYFFPNFLLE